MKATIQRGEELFAQGKIAESRDCFLAILAETPEDLQALNDLGVALSTLGERREAEGKFLKALEQDPDYLDARLNLAGLYHQDRNWEEEARQLEACLAVSPQDASLVRQLAGAYSLMGRMDRVEALMGENESVKLFKTLIGSFWSAVNYFELVEDLGLKDRLEGVVASCLAAIDGLGSPNVPFKLVSDSRPDREPVVIEGLREAFYYQKPRSARLEQMNEKQALGTGKILKVGDYPDWIYFRKALLKEINTEGGMPGRFHPDQKGSWPGILAWRTTIFTRP